MGKQKTFIEETNETVKKTMSIILGILCGIFALGIIGRIISSFVQFFIIGS